MSEIVIAIIQARMGSTRLPGKTMINICGKPILQHLIERISYCKLIDQIIVATTNKSEDDEIIQFCKKLNMIYFRGKENDVLDRYYQCAKKNQADIVIRVTGDSPFKEPDVTDKIIHEIKSDKTLDYVSNTIEPSYPIGIDIEAFRFRALETIWKYGKKPYDREHINAYLYNNQSFFKIKSVKQAIDLSHMRWTLDTKEDLEFTIAIYNKLYSPEKLFFMNDILKLLEKHPELSIINSHVKQKGFKFPLI